MREDLTGQRFGRYVVVELDRTLRVPGGTVILWLCRCDCGAERSVRAGNLKSGRSRSCGCLSADVSSSSKIKHGHSTRRHGASSTYGTWRAMIERCTDPACEEWKNYGGRGITVCERWRSFPAFLADMGERPPGRNGKRPRFTLERIDNDRGYEPGNCVWATYRAQRMNQRRMFT